MSRVTRLQDEPAREEVRLGKPKAVRVTSQAEAARQVQVQTAPMLRLSGQIRETRQAAVRPGTAFDATSRAWIPLTPGPGRGYSMGQTSQEPQLPPEPERRAGSEETPHVGMSRAEAENLIEGIDSSIAVVVRARDEDLSEGCPTVDNIVLAKARSFRARLAEAISRQEALSASPEDLQAASTVSDCAELLRGKKKSTLLVLGTAALALTVIAIAV